MGIGLDVRQNQSREAAQGVNRPEKQTTVSGKSKEAEQILSDLKANRVSDVSEVKKTERLEARQENALRASERPTRDRYVPEQPEERTSFGHYQLVSDEEGGAKVQFEAPTDGKETAGEPKEQTGEWKQAETSEHPDAGKTNGSAELAALQRKQKALEKQLKSTVDPEARKELKTKLEQIRRQLKAAKN